MWVTSPLHIGSITPSANYSATNTCGTDLWPAVLLAPFSCIYPHSVGALPGAVTISDADMNSPHISNCPGPELILSFART